jgi:hypothetical protein
MISGWLRIVRSPLMDEKRGSAHREGAFHSGGGVSGDGAEVRVLALLLEGDDESGRLARLEERGCLAVDLEVMSDVAGVLEDERDLAGLGDR